MSERELQVGFDAVLGGHNDALDPTVLKDSQYAFGLNIQNRNGLARSRPVWRELGATIPSGRFQGASTYRLTSTDRFIFGIDGSIFSLPLVAPGSIAFFANKLNSDVDRYFFAQADKFMVIQDGYVGSTYADSNFPFILDGINEVSQSGTAEKDRLPKGSHMSYGHGRLHVVVNYIHFSGSGLPSENFGRQQFVSGDLISVGNRAAVLSFIEKNYLFDGAIMPPNEMGPIQGMAFIQNASSGTGLGSLILIMEQGAAAFGVHNPRNQWQLIDIGRVMFRNEPGLGSKSPNSVINVNNDLLYRSRDGIRAFRHTVAQTSAEGAGLGTVPMSYEVSSTLAADDETHLDAVSAVRNNNRVLMTTQHEDVQGEKTFKGLVSMDTSVVSSVQGNPPPIYDGIWTGYNFTHLLSGSYQGKETIFAFVKDGAENHLIYLDEDGTTDGASSTAVKSRIYTKFYSWNDPFNAKRLSYIEMWISDIIGKLNLTVYFRRDKHAFWSKLSEGSITADTAGSRLSRSKLRFSLVGDADCDALFKNLDIGYFFQFCVEWTGHATIERARFVIAEDEIQDFELLCDDTISVKTEQTGNLVVLDDYDYRAAI